MIVIAIILLISSFIYCNTKSSSIENLSSKPKTFFSLNSTHTQHVNFASHQQSSSQALIVAKSAFSVNLLKRTTVDSFNYNLAGIFGDGLFTHLYMGSSKQKIIFSIDTAFPYLLVNNDTTVSNSLNEESTLFGLQTKNSTSFVSSHNLFNVSVINQGEYASGILAYDNVYFNSKLNISLPKLVLFGLSNYNSINIKNKYIAQGQYPKYVAEIQSDKATSSQVVSSNIIGLGMTQSNDSFLSQLANQGIIKSPLFSLYTDDKGIPNLLFGAVNPTQFQGQLAMTPILKTKFASSSLKAKYNSPFVLITGVTLINNEQDAQLNLSSTPLNIPTLLNPNKLMSYLPYSLLVELASQFGAFYSTDLSIWIQDCSFQSINGTIGFQFSEKIIQVPLKNLFVPLVNTNNDRLYLETGGYACALAFYPAEKKGYSSLGSSFFQDTYVLFDYKNKFVGLAQSRSLYLPRFHQDRSLANKKVLINIQAKNFTKSSHSSFNSSSSKIIIIQTDVGEILSVTTMSVAADDSVVTINVPSTIPNSRPSNSLTFNPNCLLTFSPSVSTTAEVSNKNTLLTTQTSEPSYSIKGVSISGSNFMASSTLRLLIPSIFSYFCIFFFIIFILLVF